jgi:hypothetical protein
VADARRKGNGIAGQFIAHPRQMLESPAMRVLSLAAHRALIRIEIEHMNHGGAENGKLPCTFADLRDWGIHKDAVAPALRELEALGFIETMKKGYRGAAGTRQASEYRLTFRPAWNAGRADGDGTHEYLKIKTVEEAEEIAAEARKAADHNNVERGKKFILPTPETGSEPTPENGVRPANFRPRKAGLQAQPRKAGLLSISREGTRPDPTAADGDRAGLSRRRAADPDRPDADGPIAPIAEPSDGPPRAGPADEAAA